MTKKIKRKMVEILMIKIDEPGEINRMEIDPEKITELAESISEIGLLQPILLRPVKDRYEIVAGHRRFLASQKLGLSVIDAVVKEMTDQEAAIIRASENLNREGLTPIEQAAIFSNLISKHKMPIERVAKKFGYKPSTIKRRMDLLRMPPQLTQAVHQGRLSVTVAEELWPISDLTHLDYLLSFALDGGCTMMVARSWVKDWRDNKRREAAGNEPTASQLAPNEPRPIYVACDLCSGAMEIGQETVFRTCPACTKIIKESI